MKVSDLVRYKDDWRSMYWWDVGLIIKIWRDPSWKDLQTKVLWSDSKITQQSIKILEVISEGR